VVEDPDIKRRQDRRDGGKAMAFYGIDVYRRDTQLCAINDDGSVVVERRFRTERAMFAEVFRASPSGKVLQESSTESVARCWRTRREVIVPDPNFGPTYAQPESCTPPA
jgi:hypothetical protein